MKNNKKGFTLIELLAVIIILAIIALIAVPQIIKILNNARKSAAQDSAYGVLKSAETYVASYMMASQGDWPGTVTISFDSNGTATLDPATPSEYVDDAKFDFKGTKPKGGVVTIDEDGKVSITTALSINGFSCSQEDAASEVKCDKASA